MTRGSRGLVELATEHRVPFMIHTDASSYRFLLPICQEFATTRFVWAHAGGILDEVVAADQVEARAIEKAREMARSPAEAYAAIKRQLRGAVIEKIERAITNLDDPQRAGWFTSETADAAKRVLAGEG